MPARDASFSQRASYIYAIVVLSALVVLLAIVGIVVGLDKESTPVVVSVIGFASTTVGGLLLALRLESVSRNVNGNLQELREQNARLSAELGIEQVPRDR